MTTYAVLFERADDRSWSAHAADLPVFAVGDTREEAEREIRVAITLYLRELASRGKPAPETRTQVGTVSI